MITTGTFVGANVWSQTTTVLQFVAKIHEMLMASSLAVVMFSYTHHHLVNDHGLPFGAALAGIQLPPQLKYLFSPELLAAFKTRSYSNRFKAHLLPVLIIFPLLVAVMGPAGAACMIPRLGSWPFFEGIFGLRNTMDDLFPMTFTYGSEQADTWNIGGSDSYIRLAPLYGSYVPPSTRNTSLLWSLNNSSVPMTLYVQTTNPASQSSDAHTATTSIKNLALITTFYSGGEPWTVKNSMDAYSHVSCSRSNTVNLTSLDYSMPSPAMTFDTMAEGPLVGRLNDSDFLSITLGISSGLEPNTYGTGSTIAFVYFPNSNITGVVYASYASDADNNVVYTLHLCTATTGYYPSDLQYAGPLFQSQGLARLRSAELRPARMIFENFTQTEIFPASSYTDQFFQITQKEELPGLITLVMSIVLTLTLTASSRIVPIASDGTARCNDRTGF